MAHSKILLAKSSERETDKQKGKEVQVHDTQKPQRVSSLTTFCSPFFLSKWEVSGDNYRTNNEPCQHQPLLREKYKMVSVPRCLLKSASEMGKRRLEEHEAKWEMKRGWDQGRKRQSQSRSAEELVSQTETLLELKNIDQTLCHLQQYQAMVTEGTNTHLCEPWGTGDVLNLLAEMQGLIVLIALLTLRKNISKCKAVLEKKCI